MDYKDIFRKETLAKLNKKSQENLKTMLGDKTLMQTMISSQQLLGDIEKAEAPYKEQLEELAKEMVEKLYPIIEEEGIRLDAKIVPMGEVNATLDEIRINPPVQYTKEFALKLWNELMDEYSKNFRTEERRRPDPNTFISNKSYTNFVNDKLSGRNVKEEKWVGILSQNKELFRDYINDLLKLKQIWKEKYTNNIQEQISPEGRRRIINSVTQGAALRGSFAFYLFKDYLDAIDPSLIDKYNEIMKNSFGIYDDDNAIAMMLSALAQNQKTAGGSSKVIINEIKINNPNDAKPREVVDYIWKNKIKNLHKILTFFDIPMGSTHAYEPYEKMPQNELNDLFKILKNNESGPSYLEESTGSGITIQARALNFPMLVHELIKGLYELVSLQGFKGDKESNQGVVNKVDKLEHEPHDIQRGKFIYDALNNIYISSPYNDSRVREYFFQEVYQLEDDEFLEFVENAINEELSKSQLSWANQTMKEIIQDLKDDEYDKIGID